MGNWDVMSSHYVKKDMPPPGTTSFTRIRLNWISPNQVVFVKPGEDRGAFLAPLEKGGSTLAMKIPLQGGQYYLIEHRRRIGFDEVQTDEGILVLSVDPMATEGTGTVKIMDATPGAENLSHSTYRSDKAGRNLFVDKQNRIAVIPLWSQGDSLGVLVTTPEKSRDALQASQMIQTLWKKGAQKGEKKQLVDDCVAAFKRYQFKRSADLAKQAL